MDWITGLLLGLEAAAALLGVYGIALFTLAMACRLAQMRSFGVPYCAPVAPYRPHNPDILLRLPLQLQNRLMFFSRRFQTLKYFFVIQRRLKVAAPP